MTRKDYITIAGALCTYHARGSKVIQAVTLELADSLSQVLQADNPRFDREHFLAVVHGERELTSRPPRKHETPICNVCRVEWLPGHNCS